MKQPDAIKRCLDENLSDVRVSRARRGEIIDQITGGIKVKKKLTTGFVLAMVLVLLSVTAFAATVLTRSPEASAILRARQVLIKEYQFTNETLGCFSPVATGENGVWTVVFHGTMYHPSLLGDYTVILDGDASTATWTHDDADKALLDSGEMTSPAWGQKQIEKALRDPDGAYAVQAPLYAADKEEADDIPDLKDGEIWWMGMNEILKRGVPGEKDIPMEQALDITYQVLKEDYNLTDEDIKNCELVDATFCTRENGGAVWGISLYLIKDGVEWSAGAIIDAQTGEIFSADITTGGNG